MRTQNNTSDDEFKWTGETEYLPYCAARSKAVSRRVCRSFVMTGSDPCCKSSLTTFGKKHRFNDLIMDWKKEHKEFIFLV